MNLVWMCEKMLEGASWFWSFYYREKFKIEIVVVVLS